MNWLEHYTALIQLISAVNFAYIATHFPTKVFGLIFDENKLLNNKLLSFKNQVSADILSLTFMQPLKTEDGRTNANIIDQLRRDYTNHNEKWEAKQNEIIKKINTAKSVKGSKCLFLNISLFCILTLFNIATFGIVNSDFVLIFAILTNIGTFLYSIYLTYSMWYHKWDGFSDVQCYRKTGFTFGIIVVTALIVSFINYMAIAQTGGTPIPHRILSLLLFLSIILPLYPCLMSIVFIMSHGKNITDYIETETSSLKIEQSKLHKRKEDLDKIDEMFSPPHWTTE